MTDAGIPRGHRGGLTLDTAAFSDGELQVSGGTFNLEGNYPVTPRAFFDTRLPLGVVALDNVGAAVVAMGNPNVGMHGDIVASKSFWITLGGGLGLPVSNSDTQSDVILGVPSVPHGLWNLHDFYPNIVPLSFETQFEGHVGHVILRLQFDPVLYIPYDNNDEVEFVIQHAGELQIGHRIGAGLRLQGVGLTTFDRIDANIDHLEGDVYQLSVEPFFAVEDDLLFARVGILLPLDEQLGPPFEQSWGFRFRTGFHID